MPTQCLAYRRCTRNSCHHENLLKITQFNYGFRNGQTEAWRGQVTCLRPHSTIPPSHLRLNPGSLLWPWELQVACEEGPPPPVTPSSRSLSTQGGITAHMGSSHFTLTIEQVWTLKCSPAALLAAASLSLLPPAGVCPHLARDSRT